MTRLRFLACAVLAVMIAVCVFGQPALAQEVRSGNFTVHAVPGQVGLGPLATPLLFELAQGFGVAAPPDGSGNPQWPCFGGGADCSAIAPGGVVIGTPAYTWSLTNCDQNNANVPPCGWIFWFYEDDTGDNTDHLIVSVTGKQTTKYVLNTGNIDFGPNPFAPGTVIVVSGNQGFGTMGQTGKNNGNCVGSGKTCVDPVAGPVLLTVTTAVGKNKITGKFTINLK
jgi:hypothetical protein